MPSRFFFGFSAVRYRSLDLSLQPWRPRSPQRSSIALSLGVMVTLAGCTTPKLPSQTGSPAATPAASTAPKVVATNSVLCDLTRRIAQETIALTCLVGPGVDPHVYQPTPADRTAIEDAKLILYGGYGLEPSLTRLVQASASPGPKVAVFEAAIQNPLRGGHDHDHAEEGHAEDKSESAEAEDSELDPHVWHDAQNGVKIVKVIEQQLATLSANNAELYQKNAQTLVDRLTQIDTWIRSQVATIPATARKLVTTHDALNYYSGAYGIPLQGALQGLSTEQEATPIQVKTLVDQVKAAQVPTVFVEKTSNPKLLETVAREAGVKLSTQPLFVDGLGDVGSGAETYDGMLLKNTETIVTGLGGKFTPFQAKSAQP